MHAVLKRFEIIRQHVTFNCCLCTACTVGYVLFSKLPLAHPTSGSRVELRPCPTTQLQATTRMDTPRVCQDMCSTWETALTVSEQMRPCSIGGMKLKDMSRPRRIDPLMLRPAHTSLSLVGMGARYLSKGTCNIRRLRVGTHGMPRTRRCPLIPQNKVPMVNSMVRGSLPGPRCRGPVHDPIGEVIVTAPATLEPITNPRWMPWTKSNCANM